MKHISKWLEKSDFSYLTEGLQEINGIEVLVYEESSIHSDKVKQTMTLVKRNRTYERVGVKEVSYDRWVDTYWYDWEQV